MRTYGRRALGALAAVTATMVVPISTTTTASAEETLRCNTSVTMFASMADGSFRKYQHDEPEIGSQFRQGSEVIGGGWDTLWFAGVDGNVYQVLGNGNLYRFHWNGSSWDRFPPNNEGWSEKIAEGWDATLTQNRVTVDNRGDFYKLLPNGDITWERRDASGTWEKRILETGAADRYDLIVAAGDGVFYVRDPKLFEGTLYRYEYDSDSQRWVKQKSFVNGGTGANTLRQFYSAGGDVMYGVESNGDNGFVWWYRYDKLTGGFKPRVLGTTGVPMGMRWAATTNSCELLGGPQIQRPVVPARLNAPTVALETTNLMTYFYVNAGGGLTVAKQRHEADRLLLDYQTLPDHQRFTGSPGVAQRQDGRYEAVANSSEDAEYRGHLQNVAHGTWPAKSVRHGGWLVSDPVVVPDADKVPSMFAVDADGALWKRASARANDGFLPWTKVGGTGISTDFTVVRKGSDFELVARLADGTVKAARITHELGAWRTVGDGIGKPAAVAHANGDLQVYVRRADNRIYTKRESAAVFPEWTVVGDIIAAGAPAAVLTGNGMVELAVRGTDDFVYQTGQLAPGSTGYRPWRVEQQPYETSTDPAGTLLPSGLAFHWRTPQGEIVAMFGTTSQSQVQARSAGGLTWTGGTARS